ALRPYVGDQDDPAPLLSEERADSGHGRAGGEREPPRLDALAPAGAAADPASGLSRRGRPDHGVAGRGVPEPGVDGADQRPGRSDAAERPPATGRRSEQQDPRA